MSKANKVDTTITTLIDLYRATTEALRSEVKVTGRWAEINKAVPTLFVDRDAFDNGRADFIINAIAPGFYDANEVKLLQSKFNNTWGIPAGTSNQYKEAKAAGKPIVAQWDAVRKEVRAMEQTCRTRFNRIREDAFPEVDTKPAEGAEGAEEEAAPKGMNKEHTKLLEAHTRCVKLAQKSEAPCYDVAAYVAHMQQGLALLMAKMEAAKAKAEA